MSDGTTVSKKFSSIEMDRDYRTHHYQSYPLICFGNYPGYTNYFVFSTHPDVKLFLQSKSQTVNSYQPSYEQPYKVNKRKYSSNQQYEEGNKPRNRRQSTNQYKPKKNEFV